MRKSKNIKSNQDRYNLAASFQETINKILVKKTEIAMREFNNEISVKTSKAFVVVGGVAANESIRNNLEKISKKMNFSVFSHQKNFVVIMQQ